MIERDVFFGYLDMVSVIGIRVFIYIIILFKII